MQGETPPGHETVDEQLAVEVVDLVLQAHRVHPFEIALEGGALEIAGANPDLGGAHHVADDARHREAALLDQPEGAAADDHRVDVDLRPARIVGQAHDEDAPPVGDLGCREAEPRRRRDGRDERVGEPAQPVVEHGDRRGGLAQARIGIFEDRERRHGRPQGVATGALRRRIRGSVAATATSRSVISSA